MDFETNSSNLLKVLFVGKNPVSIEALRCESTLQGPYQFFKAENPSHAVELVKKVSPELIFINTDIPDFNGYNFCSTVRSSTDQNKTIIALVAPDSENLHCDKAYDHGADDCIIVNDIGILSKKIELYRKVFISKQREQLNTTIFNVLNHETRTPLNSIILATDYLKERKRLNSELRNYVEIINSSSLELKTLLDKISTYCTLQEGMHLSLEKINLGRSMSEACAKELALHNVKFELCEKSNIEVRVDWIVLLKAFEMILQYATNVAPGQDPVLIRCEEGTGPICNISFEFLWSGKQSTLAHQLDKTSDYRQKTLTLYHWWNMNLAIAKAIVEAHGGKIFFSKKNVDRALITVEVNQQSITQ